MFKTTRKKIAALALVAVVALGGAVYATTALATGGASASPLTPRVAGAEKGSEWRTGMREMLEERMGLTGPEAERFVDDMIAHMENFDEGFDFEAMVDWCNEHGDGVDRSYGSGMMGGDYWDQDGSGMMGRGNWNQDDWDRDGWGMMSGGMMSGGMMGAAGPR